jgi:hypothetical protein
MVPPLILLELLIFDNNTTVEYILFYLKNKIIRNCMYSTFDNVIQFVNETQNM